MYTYKTPCLSDYKREFVAWYRHNSQLSEYLAQIGETDRST